MSGSGDILEISDSSDEGSYHVSEGQEEGHRDEVESGIGRDYDFDPTDELMGGKDERSLDFMAEEMEAEEGEIESEDGGDECAEESEALINNNEELDSLPFENALKGESSSLSLPICHGPLSHPANSVFEESQGEGLVNCERNEGNAQILETPLSTSQLEAGNLGGNEERQTKAHHTSLLSALKSLKNSEEQVKVGCEESEKLNASNGRTADAAISPMRGSDGFVVKKQDIDFLVGMVQDMAGKSGNNRQRFSRLLGELQEEREARGELEARASHLEVERNAAEDLIQKLRREHENLRRNLRDRSSEEERDRFTLDCERIELERRLKEVERERNKLKEDLLSQKNDILIEKRKLSVESSTWKHELRDLVERNRDFEKKNYFLEENEKILHEEVERLSAQLQAVSDESEQKSFLLSKGREALHDLTAQLKDSQGSIQKYQVDVQSRLEKLLVGPSGLSSYLKKRMESLGSGGGERDLVALLDKCEALEAEDVEKEEKVKKLTLENRELKMKVSKLSSILDGSSDGEFGGLMMHCQSLERDNENLRGEEKKTRDLLEESGYKYEQIKSRVDELEEERENLIEYCAKGADQTARLWQALDLYHAKLQILEENPRKQRISIKKRNSLGAIVCLPSPESLKSGDNLNRLEAIEGGLPFERYYLLAQKDQEITKEVIELRQRNRHLEKLTQEMEELMNQEGRSSTDEGRFEVNYPLNSSKESEAVEKTSLETNLKIQEKLEEKIRSLQQSLQLKEREAEFSKENAGKFKELFGECSSEKHRLVADLEAEKLKNLENEQKIMNSRRECEILKVEVQKSEKVLKNEIDKIDSERNVFLSQIASLEAKSVDEENKNSSILKASQLNEERNIFLSRKIKVLEKEILDNELLRSTRNEEISKVMNSKIEGLENEIVNLKIEAKSVNSECERLRERLQVSEERKEVLERALAGCKDQKMEIDKLKTIMDEREKFVKAITEKILRKGEQKGGEVGHVENLRKEIDMKNREISLKNSKIESLEKSLKMLTVVEGNRSFEEEAELQNLKENLEALKNEKTQLQKNSKVLEEKVFASEAEKSVVAEKLSNLKKQIERMETEKKETEKELEDLRESYETVTKAETQALSHVNDLNQKLKDFHENIEKLENEKNDERTNLFLEIDSLKEEIKNLNSCLKNSEELNQILRGKIETLNQMTQKSVFGKAENLENIDSELLDLLKAAEKECELLKLGRVEDSRKAKEMESQNCLLLSDITRLQEENSKNLPSKKLLRELELLKRKTEEKEEELKNAEEKIERMDLKVRNISSSAAESGKKDELISSLQKDILLLQTKNQEIMKKSDSLSKQSFQELKLKEKIAEQENKIKQLQMAYAQLLKKEAQEVAELKKQITQLKAVLAVQGNRVSEAHTAALKFKGIAEVLKEHVGEGGGQEQLKEKGDASGGSAFLVPSAEVKEVSSSSLPLAFAPGIKRSREEPEEGEAEGEEGEGPAQKKRSE